LLIVVGSRCGARGDSKQRVRYRRDQRRASGIAELERINISAFQTVHLSFPIPLVTTPPAGGTASLQGQGGGCVYVSGVGYQT
jgi:hypothetical protein